MMFRRFGAFLFWTACARLLGAQVEIQEYGGDQAGELLGSSVARAGDVNGDGVEDSIVGAPCAGALAADQPGYARVHSGSDGAVLRTLLGDHAGDLFGTAVAGGADLDGDGVPDFVVGAIQPFWSYLLDLEKKDAGYVSVFSGASGAKFLQVEGDPPIGRFGSSLALAGDVDLDGTVDLVVGQPGVAVASGGAVDVVSGSDGSKIHHEKGTSGSANLGELAFPIGDHLGVSVAGPGDLDGDGVPDFVAGSLADSIFGSKSGERVRAFSGATGNELYELKGAKSAGNYGAAIAAAGDVDGDGELDVAIGASSDTLQKNLVSGSVSVVSGDVPKLVLFTVGELDHPRFGSALAGAGDVNDDGFDDLAIAFGGTELDAGGVRIQSGDDGSLLAAWHYPWGNYFVSLALAPAGDVDLDGAPDLLAGVVRELDPGIVQIVSTVATIQQPLESQSFFPGDALVGSIDHSEDVDSGRFLAVAGSTLQVTVTVESGTLAPLVSLHRVKGAAVLAAIATITPTVPTGDASFEIEKLGQYALRIQGQDGTTGSYVVTTSVALPPLAASQSISAIAKKKKGAQYFAEAEFTALVGSFLDAVVTAPPGVTPSVALVDPSGQVVKASQYGVSVTGNQLTIEDIPLITSGKYELRAFGGAKGDSFAIELSPSTPSAGHTLGID